MPNPSNNLFIFRDKTFFKKFKLNKKFKKTNSKSKFYLIKNKTKGMAITINKAKHLVQLNKPVLVSSCDIKCVINYKKLYSMIKKYSPEGIIFLGQDILLQVKALIHMRMLVQKILLLI